MSSHMVDQERTTATAVTGVETESHLDADQHLQRLLAKQTDRLWVFTIAQDLKEFFFPPKLPPLQLTSKPVAVKSIWGFSGGQGQKAGLSSTLIHVSVVALLFLVGTNKHVQEVVKNQMDAIDLAPYNPT